MLGPFSLQGEAAHTWLQQDDADDASGLWGGYLGASYFLTGELRNYEADEGVFRRVRVTNPVQEGGLAAWEVGHSLRLPRARRRRRHPRRRDASWGCAPVEASCSASRRFRGDLKSAETISAGGDQMLPVADLCSALYTASAR